MSLGTAPRTTAAAALDTTAPVAGRTTGPAGTRPAGTRPAGTRPADTRPARRPSRRRRTALAVTGFLACVVPAVFTGSIAGMLLTGELADHRFHQLTGQGLLLTALWLGGLLPMLRAGWSGRRPSAGVGLLHLAFTAIGVGCATVAPGGGAPALAALVALTGALVWLALPLRPALRGPVALDPVLAPAALLSAALYVPYAIGQLELQNAAVGHHADNPHYFDMAWVVLVLVVLSVIASLRADARRVVLWTAVGSILIGAAGLAFTADAAFAGLALGLGVLTGGAHLLRGRLGRTR